MTDPLRINKDDLQPYYNARATSGDSVAIDVTGATIYCTMKNARTGERKIDKQDRILRNKQKKDELEKQYEKQGKDFDEEQRKNREKIEQEKRKKHKQRNLSINKNSTRCRPLC